jgi:hypothetical protein
LTNTSPLLHHISIPFPMNLVLISSKVILFLSINGLKFWFQNFLLFIYFTFFELYYNIVIMTLIYTTLYRDGSCVPWGFTLVGGADVNNSPLYVQRVSYSAFWNFIDRSFNQFNSKFNLSEKSNSLNTSLFFYINYRFEALISWKSLKVYWKKNNNKTLIIRFLKNSSTHIF